MKILIITDNEYIFKSFKEIVLKLKVPKYYFDFRYSYKNEKLIQKYKNDNEFKPINVKKEMEKIIEIYDKVISLHSKQIFPKELVEIIPCINVHPGYNPENRGWYPQVFSIINKKQAGVTIHYMDEYLDHGKVIIREKVEMKEEDTSLTLYERIQKKEVELLKKYLEDILEDKILGYDVAEGNINYLSDFKKLCELNLNEKLTFREAIDRLRALSHGEYNNAYFYNKFGEKIYVKLNLYKEE